MTLRRQLLLVSLLLLALPWAGCQYVIEMESALQSGQARALLATSRAVSTVISGEAEVLYPDPARITDDGSKSLYATLSSGPVIVDGYDDGWNGSSHARYGALAYRAKIREGKLYLLITVDDSDVIYHDPRQARRATGDRVILVGGRGRYIISTAAPGAVQAKLERRAGPMGFEPRIRGFWQDSLMGYTVELEMPLSLLGGRLGFYVVDAAATTGVDGAAVETETVLPGNIEAQHRGPLPWLVHPSAALQSNMAAFTEPGMTLTVVDRQGWIAALTENHLNPVAVGSETPWILRAIYRAVLSQDAPEPLPNSETTGQLALAISDIARRENQASTQWFAQADNRQRKWLLAAAPITTADNLTLGAVIARQSSEQYLSLTDKAFSRLLYWSLLAIIFSALGLLGYASWLSWRIRKLSQASRTVIQADGSLSDTFPVSRQRDEIGELSRQYAELIRRLREYTDYLRSLSRKLSHELRTPIAVIQSSLDNLDAQRRSHDTADNAIYVTRAREGLARLTSILNAMSEASRLEESVHGNELEHYDVTELLQGLFNAYRDLYADKQLTLDLDVNSLRVFGAPDLIAQMLDKLIDNAASFAPADGLISLTLRTENDSFNVSVSNQGPLLPSAMQQSLFDSMVSVRERTGRMHLGLGLHIVRLIVDFHGGTVTAANLEDGSGVRFDVRLPRSIRA